MRMRDKKINLGLLVLCSAVFLIYGMNSKNFHVTTLSSDMTTACCLLAACMAVPFGHAVFAAYSAKASMQREIELLKLEGVTRGKVEIAPKKSRSYVQMTILAVAVLCLVFGLLSGGTNDVLTKAVNICTECVGLG